jgi:1-acyl-sn-glycerol-3-phosphate acyltransferase
MRTLLSFLVLLSIKLLSRLFYLYRMRWVDPVPEKRWADIRLIVLLNHTSLFEWLFAGSVPIRFLWRIARHAVIPAAQKTLDRPVVGLFFRLLARHVIPITRRPDESWRQVLDRVDPQGMVLILPEGRMMRPTGLDLEGHPMTIKGGVADILDGIPEGRLLCAYSAGLYHVQVPGQKLPRLFRRIEMSFENLDIVEYKQALNVIGARDGLTFKQAMKADMERRKQLWAKPFSGPAARSSTTRS